MADFEGLIRQALARHNATDPSVRERVYQSSRNALAKMIANAGPQPIEAIDAQRRSLENSIARIEAAYAVQSPAPRAAPEPVVARPKEQPAPGFRAEPRLDPPQPRDARPEVEPETYGGIDDFTSGAPPVLQRQSRNLPRILGFFAIIAILALVGWLAWTTLAPLILESGQRLGSAKPAGSDPEEAATDAAYITILSPTDTGGLVTAGRGTAQIVKFGETDMIRLTSTRPNGSRDKPADPVLIGIGEGALREIAGKRVTVEIQAKSGASSPATFAIGCDFAGEDACGRKRFRLGLQPEAIVFTIEIPESLGQGGEANLTLSTDVTNSAAVNGEGDAVDIAYARLRYQDR